MGVIADMIRSGADPDLVERMANELADVRVQEARRSASEAIEPRTARQLRNARYYERKASEKRLNASEQDVSDDSKTVNPSAYIAHADAPVCSNGSSLRSEPELDNPDLKIGPLAPKEPAHSVRSILFDRFYTAYPKHTNRKSAAVKFLAAVRSGVDAERIIAAAARFAEAHRSAMTEPKYVMAPDVWLNKGKWDDEDLPTAVSPSARDGPRRNRGWAAAILGSSMGLQNGPPSEENRDSKVIPLISAVGEVGGRTSSYDDSYLFGDAVGISDRRSR